MAAESWFPTAQLALDGIFQRRTQGIPTWGLFVMQHSAIERIAGAQPGAYRADPVAIYLKMQQSLGACLLDQWIPHNPLTMGDLGYEDESDVRQQATSGIREIVCDGIRIDGPEAVAEHLERVVFPALRSAIAGFDEAQRVAEIIAEERRIQRLFGPGILKTGYGFIAFPAFAYTTYGYEAYFEAYALYPEVVERHFALQADYAVLNNRAAARAYAEGGFPPLYRLDHDMADSRGLLVRPQSLDRLWMPHFARALAPVLALPELRLIWHCDGNLMALVPRLLEVGIRGFQGFQTETGMDYPAICRMRDREGQPLLIKAGVSVTRTLPYGRPADVKRELDTLVALGPETGLFLGASSSITPGVPWENLATLIDGLAYYRNHGR